MVVALELARTVSRRIRYNLAWVLGYNTAAITMTAGALYPVYKAALPPSLAALAMVLSRISVLASSLWINWYRPPEGEGPRSINVVDRSLEEETGSRLDRPACSLPAQLAQRRTTRRSVVVFAD